MNPDVGGLYGSLDSCDVYSAVTTPVTVSISKFSVESRICFSVGPFEDAVEVNVDGNRVGVIHGARVVVNTTLNTVCR